ncbi:hydroxymethylpyrimidine/phosphomethylpyrimidine kinase [bacterium]|nr:hydroxymethylpyrimidine/phosphomethylpyrimidine kinase [bacterium]
MSSTKHPPPPTVLCLSGHDPSGGAGQIADVQAITAQRAHPALAITCNTVQDTVNARRIMPVPVADVIAQAEAVLADQPVACIKLGLLASRDIGDAVAKLLAKHAGIPLVIDPVLVASGGGTLADAALRPLLAGKLAGRASILTPNTDEVLALTGAPTARAAAHDLLGVGAQAVLVTDGDGNGATVNNQLFLSDGTATAIKVPRLPGRFHGSGCTLAAALAARLAHGDSLHLAVQTAIAYTQRTLAAAFSPGKGQAIPLRNN